MAPSDSAPPRHRPLAASRTSRPRFRPAAFIFRFRDYLAPAVVIVALLGSRPTDFVADRDLDVCAEGSGAVLLAVGLAIRWLVAAQVDIRRSGVRKRVAASRLVVAGLYAQTRNPLYVANVTLALGLTLVYDSRPAYVILPLVVLGFLAVVRLEEEFLAVKFGDEYGRYRERVPRFVPRLRGLAATIRGTALDWRRALRREYGSAFATVTAALVLAGVKRVTVAGLAASTPRVYVLIAAWVVCFCAYCLVRWLKKTERLETSVDVACAARAASHD